MNIITKILLSQAIMLCTCFNSYSMESINSINNNTENKCLHNTEIVDNIENNSNEIDDTDGESINRWFQERRIRYDCNNLFFKNIDFFVKLKLNTPNDEDDINFLLKTYFLSQKVSEYITETLKDIKDFNFDLLQYYNDNIEVTDTSIKAKALIISKKYIENIKFDLYKCLENILFSGNVINNTTCEVIVNKLYDIQNQLSERYSITYKIGTIDYSNEIKDLTNKDFKPENFETIYERIIGKVDDKLKLIDDDIKIISSELWKCNKQSVIFYFDKEYNNMIPTVEFLSLLLNRLKYLFDGINEYFTTPIKNKQVKDQIKDNKYLFRSIVHILRKIKMILESDIETRNSEIYNDPFTKHIEKVLKPCGLKHSCIYYIEEIEKTFDKYFN